MAPVHPPCPLLEVRGGGQRGWQTWLSQSTAPWIE
eukprot:CAMPEP_0172191560 /NCGR_PEP_ID=MMETSP1050-20130122/23773_1 /TAXON_ID=233186 /ORGANISM="Cryptomonas curvata, Strain CCAP979/52" /LENGTH=34 /DNA_ID= /DNA_START= /DNA_END= /DNA_ORIENTATION=